MSRKEIDRFAGPLLMFLAGLHNCNSCRFIANMVSRKGKRVTFCTKYNLPLKRVREACIDKFPGFTNGELEELARQRRTGAMRLIIAGEAV